MRESGERRARPRSGRARRCSTPASRRSRTPPPAAFLGREKLKLTRIGRRPPAGRAGRRRPRRHARRHAHDPADPRPRRAGLRGRGDRHRRRRRPPAERGRRDRHPVLRRAEDRRPEPARDRRGARRGPLRPRPPVLAPGPPGSARWLLARVLELPLRRQLPHRAGRLRRAAQRPGRSSRRWRRSRCGTFYGACDVVLSPSPASDERLRRARDRRRADRALGPRRRPRALRPGAARRRACCPARSTSSTPAG